MNDFIIVAGEPTARRGLGLSSTLLMRVADSDGNYHTTGGERALSLFSLTFPR